MALTDQRQRLSTDNHPAFAIDWSEKKTIDLKKTNNQETKWN